MLDKLLQSPLQLTLVVAAAVIVLILAAVFIFVRGELLKTPPKGGSSYKIPANLLSTSPQTTKSSGEIIPFTIQHWQASETDFLFTEIWGSESAYSGQRGAVINFRPGATIIDAGANIGMFSLYAAARCQGAATIYSFEPIPSTFAVLQENAKQASEGRMDAVLRRGDTSSSGKLNWQPLNLGLSTHAEETVFSHHPHFSVWSTGDPKFAAQRLDRILGDLPRATRSSPNPLVRLIPSSLVSWFGSMFLHKMGSTEKTPVKLVPLSQVIDEKNIKNVDVLKVDVEGAEEAVLAGIREEHWARIQQVVLEVESFEIRDRITKKLEKLGFATTSFASERERNPGVQSEVCMMYAVRPEYAATKSKR